MLQVKRVCLNNIRGIKHETDLITLESDFGILGDYHALKGSLRQVSLLLDSEIDKVRKAGLFLKPGAFGENIIIVGGCIEDFIIGNQIAIGENVILEITIIGKECHTPCSIQEMSGMCIMPETGIFCKVIKGGDIKNGDRISHCK